MSTTTALVFVVVGAAALSVAQAWSTGRTPSVAWRYAVAWSVCTVVLVLPELVFLGFPHEIASAHRTVAWTALVLSALTAAAALAIARWRRPPEMLRGLPLPQRARRLFPIHLVVLIVLAAVHTVILGFVFLSNIH
jgi:hypothetical protein